MEAMIAAAAQAFSTLENVFHLFGLDRNTEPGRSIAAQLHGLRGIILDTIQKLHNELLDFRRDLVASHIPLEAPVDQVELIPRWWGSRKDRVARQVAARVEGIKNQLLLAVDDCIAIARCGGREDALIQATEAARQAKARIREMTNPALPIGRILDDLIQFVEERLVHITAAPAREAT